MAKADRERTAFVASMGISRELDDLIKTVKFESIHALTRTELYRFGIDTRPLPETAWTLEAATRPYVRKVAVLKQGDGGAFRAMEWRLFCENGKRARLMFVRESDPSAAAISTVMMMAGAEKSVSFGKFPARVGKYDVWSQVVALDAMEAILAASRLQMGEGTQSAEGKANLATFDIDTVGLGDIVVAAPDILPRDRRSPGGLDRRSSGQVGIHVGQGPRSTAGHAFGCSCIKVAS